MLANTVTPDGYRVDNNGAWIQNAKPSGHWGTRTVVDKAAWTETIDHPAKTHIEQVWVPKIETIDTYAGKKYICGCGFSTFNRNEMAAHREEGAQRGETHNGWSDDIYDSVQVDNGHYETKTVDDEAAWTETIDHPAQTHTEKVWVED